MNQVPTANICIAADEAYTLCGQPLHEVYAFCEPAAAREMLTASLCQQCLATLTYRDLMQ